MARRKISELLLNFWVDIVIFIAFVVDMNVPFTGLPIHEWLGIAFGISIVYHLLLHWKWMLSVTQRILSRLPSIQRFRYVVDVLFFVDIVVLVITGLWISEVALRQIGLATRPNLIWRALHIQTADWAIWLVGLHIALDWKWVLSPAQRYLVKPIRSLATFVLR